MGMKALPGYLLSCRLCESVKKWAVVVLFGCVKKWVVVVSRNGQQQRMRGVPEEVLEMEWHELQVDGGSGAAGAACAT
jgi:hypothetical protein